MNTIDKLTIGLFTIGFGILTVEAGQRVIEAAKGASAPTDFRNNLY